jgi:sensor histidine kinase YesM
LSVINDGPESQLSLESPDAGPIREGIGLSNTRKRLEALYGEHQTIALRPRPGGGVETIIEIPLHWSSADPPEARHSLEAARG